MPPRCSTGSPASPAGLFVQLSTRIHQPTILDVFAPLQLRALHQHHFGRTGPRRSSIQLPSAPRIRISQQRDAPDAIRRSFTSTPARRRTVALHNPQNDEDGKEMTLHMTPRAAKRLSQIMTKDHNPSLALRIQVESGGCHGFQYLMSLTTLPPLSATASSSPTPEALPSAEAGAALAPSTTTSSSPSMPAISEDDTIFVYVPDEATSDAALATDLPKMVIDAPSLELLKGSKVDFTQELIGSQFKIVDNPAATSSCGCGTSFDIKI